MHHSATDHVYNITSYASAKQQDTDDYHMQTMNMQNEFTHVTNTVTATYLETKSKYCMLANSFPLHANVDSYRQHVKQ
jgi:hypothetical protein